MNVDLGGIRRRGAASRMLFHSRLLGSAIGIAVFFTTGAASARPPQLRCEQVSFQVGLTDDGPADQKIVGWLCARGSIRNKTIQVLLHGGTYDHTYWDFPFRSQQYSYVRWATDAGYATLNLDRLGAGQSSKPDANGLTLHTNATAIHQVVQALRAGTVRLAEDDAGPASVPGLGAAYSSRVMLVGHSLGSFISTIEASTYHDVDGVILSGYSHSTGPGAGTLEASLYPASLDPKFAGAALPSLYFTTLPGTRARDFYFTPNADPAVIALDEELKQTSTLGEVADIPASFAASMGITVPTLVAVGDYDTVDCRDPSCSASRSLVTEPASYSPEACVQVIDIPESGHDLNLHRNAPLWYALATTWSELFVGSDARRPPPLTCR